MPIYAENKIVTTDDAGFNISVNFDINKVKYFRCNSYQMPINTGNRSGCAKVAVGQSVIASDLPGQLDYNVRPGTYSYTRCHNYDVRTDRRERVDDKLAIVKNTTLNTSYVKRFPNTTVINRLAKVSLAGTKVELSSYYNTLKNEYTERIKHAMYKSSDETEHELKLDLQTSWDQLISSISTATESTEINNKTISAVRATAEIMNNIVKVLKVMDKGTSYYKDAFGKKVTAGLKYNNLAGDLIVASKVNQGNLVLSALNIINKDCICYSDCGMYAVCYCYGHCNDY